MKVHRELESWTRVEILLTYILTDPMVQSPS